MKTVAVILSGGSGSRFGGAIPKQFTKLAGKAIIEYTVDAFEESLAIDEIIIVSKAEFLDRTWQIVHNNNWKKVVKVIVGGKERFDSTYSAITALQNYPKNTKVLFHDAVRPLISDKIIQDCVDKLELFSAVDVVIPSSDTIVEVYDDGCIANIPNRTNMRRGQTPQAFHLGVIQEAYQLAIDQKRFIFTCDCGVIRAMLPHIRVATVEGSERNRKITKPIDLFIVEKQLQHSDRISIDDRVDLTQFKNKVIVIFGGSSGIGQAIYNIAKINEAHVYIASRSYNNVDITNKQSIELFLADIYQEMGRIDYIINTVGLLIKKPLDTLLENEFLDLININYTGALYIAMGSKKYLSQTQGMLLNFTSSSYTRGRAYYAIYSSTNAAIVNLTQALAEEWHDLHIRVNCINPERTNTPMRTSNFGIENPDLLLTAEQVAYTSLSTLLSHKTGLIVDIRKDGR